MLAGRGEGLPLNALVSTTRLEYARLVGPSSVNLVVGTEESCLPNKCLVFKLGFFPQESIRSDKLMMDYFFVMSLKSEIIRIFFFYLS